MCEATRGCLPESHCRLRAHAWAGGGGAGWLCGLRNCGLRNGNYSTAALVPRSSLMQLLCPVHHSCSSPSARSRPPSGNRTNAVVVAPDVICGGAMRHGTLAAPGTSVTFGDRAARFPWEGPEMSGVCVRRQRIEMVVGRRQFAARPATRPGMRTLHTQRGPSARLAKVDSKS